VTTDGKPRLRGVFHQLAFFVTLVVGGVIVWGVRPAYRVVELIYVVTLATQFGVSTLYHRPDWAPGPRRWLRRADHATIFLLIAGTATPLAWSLPSGPRQALLWIFWVGALVGVVRAIVWISAPKWLVALIALALGSACWPFLPAFSQALDRTTVAFIAAGGIVYSLGAVVYALRRPNPWPRTFGYHEIFHVLTIVAAACEIVAMARTAGLRLFTG
jgi:hemolysin III